MKKILKNYGFVLTMLLGVIGGCVVGAIFPVVKDDAGEVLSRGATVLEPLGTVFINTTVRTNLSVKFFIVKDFN